MEYILIDDDLLLQAGWKLKAAKANIKLRCYSDIKDFLKNAESHAFDCNIYIDSNLKDGLHGEIEAKHLKELGYENIYLTTGFTDLSLDDFPWLRGIINKKPPF